jgi:hypothetical protein
VTGEGPIGKCQRGSRDKLCACLCKSHLRADLACTKVRSRMGLALSQSKMSQAQNRAWLCPDFGVGLTACRAPLMVSVNSVT